VDRETKESAKGKKSLNHPLLPLITLYNPFEFFSFSRYPPYFRHPPRSVADWRMAGCETV